MVWIFKPGKPKLRNIRAAGQADGHKAVPGENDPDVSPFERILVDQGEQVLREFEGDFKSSEAQLYPRFKAARDDFRRAKQLYEQKIAELKRPVTKHISMWAYVTSLIAIVLVELPVNFFALSVFSEIPILTGILALLLGAVLMIVAHNVGMTLRHKGMTAFAVLAVLVTIGIVCGMAYLRVKYFETPDSIGYIAPALAALDPRALATIFALMNILFILVATWLSFLSHDADEHYDLIFTEYQRSREAAVTLASKRGKAFAEIEKDAKDYIEMIHRQIQEYRRANLNARGNTVAPASWPLHSTENTLNVDTFAIKLVDNEVE